MMTAYIALALHRAAIKKHLKTTRENCPRSRIEVRSTALLRYHAYTRCTLTLTLTYDLYFQSQASYGYDP